MTERWAYLRRVRESPGFDEDNTDSQEVLEDVVLRVTAREYLDTVRAVLTSGTEEVGQTADTPPQASQVSPLGEAVLREPTLSQWSVWRASRQCKVTTSPNITFWLIILQANGV